MTDDELNQIETALGESLPEFYRRFMLEFPADQIYQRAESGRRVDSWEFTNRPARVVRLNREVSRPSKTFDGEPWPGYFVIGGSKAGDYFCLAFRSVESVLWWPWNDRCFVTVAASLPEFVQWLMKWRKRNAR